MGQTEQIRELAKGLDELQKRKLSLYRPHPKQAEFLKAGSTKRERCLLANNRGGKTLTCGFEAGAHSTGLYPDWWEGHRIRVPNLGWAGGESNETTRDLIQTMLLGPEESSWGTGMIPARCIKKIDKARGIVGAVDKVYVRHVSGGISIIQFKSYEQGWQKWTGSKCHWVWFDEEPDEDIYKEGLTRTNDERGPVFMSLTPLMGMTEVVGHFFPRPDTPARHLTMMTIDDCPHFTDEQRQEMIDQYAPYEREARLKGIPMLGSGRIFPVADSVISCAPFDVPLEWPQGIGMDFGYDHPTAAAKMAWDRDADRIYVTHEYRVAEEIPIVHAHAIRAWGDWIWCFWPHDGNRRGDRGGTPLAQEYRDEGRLRMWHEHAQFESGGVGVEAGLMEMLDRMRTGRWKVFTSCPMWLEEFHTYHRKDGKVVDFKDDLISASRVGMMMKRFFRANTRRQTFDHTGDWNPLSQTQRGMEWR